jgi:hypothetical protein
MWAVWSRPLAGTGRAALVLRRVGERPVVETGAGVLLSLGAAKCDGRGSSRGRAAPGGSSREYQDERPHLDAGHAEGSHRATSLRTLSRGALACAGRAALVLRRRTERGVVETSAPVCGNVAATRSPPEEKDVKA